MSLAAGGVQEFSDPQDLSCVTLAATGAEADYLFVVANATSRPDVLSRYDVSTTAEGSVTSTASSVSPSVASAGAVVKAPLPLDVHARFESRLRATERRLLRPADASAFLRARRAAGAPSGVRASVVSPAVVVGSQVTYKVPDGSKDNVCDNFFTVGGVVKAISQHAIIVQDTAAPANGFTGSDFSAIAAEFDQYIYPTDTSHFGGTTDVDANDKVVMLLTPRINELTPRNSDGFIAGFFFAGDLFPPSDCAQSNEAEIFYLLAPDPTGRFGDAHSTSDVRQGTRGTVAHEFQHMINAGRRITGDATSFEATWLDEALAHLAEELVGRAEHGYGDLQRLTISDVADEPALNDFNAFFYQNIARFKTWLQRPDTAGATSAKADQSLAVRGAAWSLLRYTADHHSGGNFAAFTRSLAGGPDTGVVNLTQKAGVPFGELMRGWMVANFADGLSIDAADSQYAYAGWNMRSVEGAISNGTYPLKVTAIGSQPDTTSTQSPSASGNYFRFSTASSPQVSFGISATNGGALPAGLRLYVLRVR